MPKESKRPERTRIGQVVGAFGLRGQLKVQPLTNIEEWFEKGATVFLQGEPRTITNSKIHKNRYLLTLEGITRLEHAQPLQWEYLETESEPPELDDDEYLIDDLIGLTVVTEAGVEVGKVTEVLAYPAQDILVVGEHMIPAVAEFVKEVDFDEETITIHAIDGLLGESAGSN